MARLFRRCVVLVLMLLSISLTGVVAEQSRSSTLTLQGTIAPRIGIQADVSSITIEPLDDHVRVNLMGLNPYSNLNADRGYEIRISSRNALLTAAMAEGSNPTPSTITSGSRTLTTYDGQAVLFDSHRFWWSADYRDSIQNGEDVAIIYDASEYLQDTIILTLVVD